MTLWVALAVMSLVAVLFAIGPLYRKQRRISPLVIGSTVFVLALSVGLYSYQGRPELPSAASSRSSSPPLERFPSYWPATMLSLPA